MTTELEEKVTSSLVDGKLPCPVAFKIAGKLKVTSGMVGDKADELKIRIIDCQLGCFGLKKATHEDLKDRQIDDSVAEGIRAHLIDGQLPCSVAFEIARKLKVRRRKVGDTATQLRIMLVDCQLGCF